MTEPLTVKCPTCGQGRGRNCIRLAVTPDKRIVWAGREPHPQRSAIR